MPPHVPLGTHEHCDLSRPPSMATSINEEVSRTRGCGDWPAVEDRSRPIRTDQDFHDFFVVSPIYFWPHRPDRPTGTPNKGGSCVPVITVTITVHETDHKRQNNTAQITAHPRCSGVRMARQGGRRHDACGMHELSEAARTPFVRFFAKNRIG